MGATFTARRQCGQTARLLNVAKLAHVMRNLRRQRLKFNH